MAFRTPLRPLAVLAVFGLVSLGCSSKAAQLAGKALDANNTHTGTADAQAVAVTTSSARNVAVTADAANVIYAQDNGDVFEVPVAAAVATPTKLGNFAGFSDADQGTLSVDATYIWYHSSSLGIFRMPRAGGAVEQVTTTPSKSNFIILPNAIIFASDTTKLSQLDPTTKTVTDFVTGFQQIGGFVLDTANNKIWVTDIEADTVSWIPTASADAPPTATVAVSDQPSPEAIGIGGGYIYWDNGLLGDNKAFVSKLVRYKTDGSAQAEIVADTSGGFASPVFADANYVYYGMQNAGLERAPAAPNSTGSYYLGLVLSDFIITDQFVFAVENNGNSAAAADRTKPNRLLAVTK